MGFSLSLQLQFLFLKSWIFSAVKFPNICYLSLGLDPDPKHCYTNTTVYNEKRCYFIFLILFSFRYEEALASGTLSREGRSTARQIAK